MADSIKSCKTWFCFILLICALSYIPPAQAQGDITPPEVFSFTPSTIDVSSTPHLVTFTLRITDNASGFQTASWRLVSFSGQQFFDIAITASDRISGNSLDGIYEKAFELPSGSETGAWHVADVRVSDIEGNIRYYDDMPVYNSPAMFNADSGASRVFAHDFNLDGITDIAVTAAATVTVYPGAGDGTFGLGIASPAGPQVQVPMIGDFNGDGVPDIAYQEEIDFEGGVTPVGVLFGNGDGTFQPYRTVGSMPYEVGPTVGDFDGDGKSDMAGVGWTAGGLLDPGWSGIVFLWGRGDGNFDRTELIIDIGDSRSGHNLFTADFNGDGVPDLVWGKYKAYDPSTFCVMLGQGSRTFGSPIEHTSAGKPDAYAAADFNSDGNMDLAVHYGGAIGILQGNGDGTFQPVTFIKSVGGGQLSTWDIDRDGRPDLATNAGDGFMVLANNGDGTFRQYILTAGVTYPHTNEKALDFEIADFNDDGRTDFAVAFHDYTVGVYLGIPATAVSLASSSPTSMLGEAVTLTATVTPAGLLGPVTFYDGATVIGSALLEDGQAVFTTKLLETGTHALRASYRGTLMGSAASFSPEVSHTVSAGLPSSGLLALPEIDPGFIPARLASGDFNNDGRMDFVARDYGGDVLYVFLGNGDGTFQKMLSGSGGGQFIFRPVVVGDLNNDGNLDIDIATQTGTAEYLGDGSGSFQWQRSIPGWPVLGDVNRDGTLDRVYVDGANVSVLLGKGDRDGGLLSFPISSAGGASGLSAMAMGDLNGDRNLDVAVTAETENLVNILLGNGDGTFQTPMTIPTGTGPICPVVADFNGDAKLDLAFIQTGSGTVRILLGEGNGGFLPAIDTTLGGTLNRMIAADLDGDGTPDLAVLSESLDRLLVLPGNGNGTFGAAQMYYAGSIPYDLIAADFNGDGRKDLAVASIPSLTWVSPGKISILLGVNPSPTSVVLNVSAPSSTLSQEITMTATVGPSGASGWVTFYDGATPLGSAQVIAGQATFQTGILDSGKHLLRAVFSGDRTVYSSSVSSVQSHNVAALSVFEFGPPVNLHSSDVPPAQADFNADGIIDLAVVSGGYVTLLLGQGNGQFSASAPYPFGSTATHILTADFNHDGKTDILVNDNTNSYFLYLGKGDGTIESPKAIPMLGDPWAKFAADFNADGSPDLLDLAGPRVFMNRGDGSFESPIQINLGFTIFHAAVGDLNGDGRADVVVPNPSNGNAYVLLGKGDGTFLSPVPYPTVSNPTYIAVADFNGDGTPDLAVTSSTGNRIGIMLGLGPGTFENWGDAIKGSTDYMLDTCDCDGDGKTDLLTFGSQNVFFLRGLGDGTFEDGIEYISSPNYVWPQFLTDLNRDGRPDLIMHYTHSEVTVSMALYPSSVDLQASPSSAKLSEVATLTATLTPADATGTVAFYDDAVLLGEAAIAGGQAVLQTKWLGPGVHKLRVRYSGDPLRYADSVSANVSLTIAAGTSGGFGAGTTFETGRGPKGVAPGDLNGDGVPDLVVANATSNTISVLLGDGAGGFAPRVGYNTGSAPVAVAIAELNGDGNLDVAVANSGSSNVSVLPGNGDGTLQTVVNYALGGTPGSFFAADLNDDQSRDLVVAVSNGVYALLGTGGAFSVEAIAGSGVSGVGAADLNGDGRIDMPWSGTSYITALLQQPEWTFTSAPPVSMGTTVAGMVMGDFNGDGHVDLATANTGSNNASVTLGNGDGTFQTAVSYATGTGPTAIVSTDCNGDGRLDLAVVNGSGNSVSILLGKGNGAFMPGRTITTGNSPMGVAAADFNNDGIVDLAVTNSSDNTVSVFLGVTPPAPVDYDPDAMSDPVVWRPDSGTWFGLSSETQGHFFDIQWGISSDIPVPGDYDGDGTADIAVWRPESGTWHIIHNGDPGAYSATQWGVSTDKPVPADYDGDGKTDIAVWRPEIGTWFILQAGAPDGYIAVQWGLQTDKPVPADYDGDGRTDIAVWRPESGTWFVLHSGTPGEITVIQWGISTDKLVPADYDGDARADMAVWRPDSGVWYILPSSEPEAFWEIQWGVAADVPVSGDYDGDCRTDIAVWRPGEGMWYLLPSASPGSYTATQWGVATDVPISPLTGILRSSP